MRLRWTPAAAADLEQIHRYLKEHMPDMAQSTVIRLYRSIQLLKEMPERGRQGRVRGTRELVLAPLPYIVVYRIKNTNIEILHVRHGAQDYSPA